MVPVHTKFGFEMGVLTAGFLWMNPQELRVKAVTNRQGQHFPVGREQAQFRFLVPNVPADVEPIAKGDCPDDCPTLFREFAELDHTKPDALLGFANAHGELGCPITIYCDPNGPAAGFFFKSSATNPCDNKPALRMSVETLADWTRHIVRLNAAVTIREAINQGGTPDRHKLESLFRWQRGESNDRERWTLDTHPNLLSPENLPPERIREVVRDWYGNPFDDRVQVARWWLVSTVNDALDGVASPQLVIDPKTGGITEELAPRTLLAVLWAQLFRAIGRNKRYEQCKACREWFEVSNSERGSTVRRRYCSDVCRVRDHRARQRQAVELFNSGTTPKQIVERFASEGHDVDIGTVKKWIKSTPKRS
jgi:hypothetical protein